MKRKLVWSEPAVEDIQSIFDFISKDSEYYARSFTGEIIDQAERLSDFPNIGRMVPEYMKSDIRELIFRNYRIIYRLEDEGIIILTVIHGKRDLTAHQE